MYGVVEVKGHQYRVKAGDVVDVQKLDAEVGSTVELDKVLFLGGSTPKVGTPVVAGAKVVAEVVRQARSRKVLAMVRKPGKYRKRFGHRQAYTALKIKEIVG